MIEEGSQWEVSGQFLKKYFRCLLAMGCLMFLMPFSLVRIILKKFSTALVCFFPFSLQWMPVVPEMESMAASDGIHDSGLNDGSGGGGSDPMMSQASGGHELGPRSPNMTNCEGTDFRVNAVMNANSSGSGGLSESSGGAAAAAAGYGGGASFSNGNNSPSQFSAGSGGSNSSNHSGGGGGGSGGGGGGGGGYTTLTPLQPLPPISSVSEKFSTTPQGFHFITPVVQNYQYTHPGLLQTNFSGITQRNGRTFGALKSLSVQI